MLDKAIEMPRKQIMDALGVSQDLHHQMIDICGLQLELFALSSLVDIAGTLRRLIQIDQEGLSSWDTLQLKLGTEAALPHDEIVQGILEGRTLLIHRDWQSAWMQSTPQQLTRSVTNPQNQNLLGSSQAGFIEDLMTNLGLIRNELRTSSLQQAHVTVGSTHKKKMILLSLDGAVDSQAFVDAEAALRAHSQHDFISLRQIAKWLCRKPVWSPIPTFIKTESPHETVYFVKQGRIVLLIEGYAEAIVVPVYLPDLFMSDNDRDYPVTLTAMLVFFRILGSIIAISAPASYVALLSVNPDVMKLELIYSLAKSSVGVPYPTITEALILLFIIDMLLEAIIRLPKSIGPAVTMVGGIILGQAVVEAKLVSNLLIIVLAAATIGNFTIIGYHFALAVRIWRYLMLFFAALFGPMGIVCGLFLLLSLIASSTVMKKPLVSMPQMEGRNHKE